jgi:hypothetical protein
MGENQSCWSNRPNSIGRQNHDFCDKAPGASPSWHWSAIPFSSLLQKHFISKTHYRPRNNPLKMIQTIFLFVVEALLYKLCKPVPTGRGYQCLQFLLTFLSSHIAPAGVIVLRVFDKCCLTLSPAHRLTTPGHSSRSPGTDEMTALSTSSDGLQCSVRQ